MTTERSERCIGYVSEIDHQLGKLKF